MKNSSFLYLVLCAERARSLAPRIKLNRETKNFSRNACNLRLNRNQPLSKNCEERIRAFMLRAVGPDEAGVCIEA